MPNFLETIYPKQRYCDFLNSPNGRCGKLGFLKSQNFIGYWGPEGRDATA